MSEARYLVHEAGAGSPQFCVRCGVMLAEEERLPPKQWVGQRDNGSLAMTYLHDGEELETDEVFCAPSF